MMSLRSAVWMACGLVAACAPTFNWREVALPDGTSRAMFPCKPSQERRVVPMAGAPTDMTILACRTGDVMFAVAVAEVGDPHRIGASLVALKEAALANVGGQATPERMPVEGTSPQASEGAFRVTGRLPDGRPIDEQLVLFAYGTRVYQVTAFGTTLPEEPKRTFFGSIRLR